MGWISALGDIALGVAAPFTGGASLSFIPAVNGIDQMAQGTGDWDKIGSAATGAAKGAQSAQQLQNQQQIDFNKDKIGLFNSELNQQKQNNDIAVNNPQKFAGQNAIAGALLNEPDTPTFTNPRTGETYKNLSYRPMNDSTRQAETELQSQTLNNLLNSPKQNPVPSANSVVAPTLKEPTGSPLANVLGTAGALAKGLGGLLKPGQPGYDPTGDAANYDDNGNYIGVGAYDDSGNWTDLFGSGWQGDDPSAAFDPSMFDDFTG